MIICKKCEHYNHGICDKCGCILKAKTRVDFLLDKEGISIDGCPIRNGNKLFPYFYIKYKNKMLLFND